MRFRFAAPLLATGLLTGCGSGISLDEPIEGPIWRLEQLGDQPIAPSADPRQDAQLQFDRATGRVTGSGGCNRLMGSFVRSGGSLQLSQLATTRMACLDPARGANETQFFAALQSTTGYRLQGPTRMSLIDAGGRTLAILSAR
jgi:putative lipoprotein